MIQKEFSQIILLGIVAVLILAGADSYFISKQRQVSVVPPESTSRQEEKQETPTKQDVHETPIDLNVVTESLEKDEPVSSEPPDQAISQKTQSPTTSLQSPSSVSPQSIPAQTKQPASTSIVVRGILSSQSIVRIVWHIASSSLDFV